MCLGDHIVMANSTARKIANRYDYLGIEDTVVADSIFASDPRVCKWRTLSPTA
jgi:hypothetical protein